MMICEFMCVSQIIFVDFANTICEFSICLGDFLGLGGNMVFSYHKHHGAISSLRANLCIYVFSQMVFVDFANAICGFLDFLGISLVGVVTRSFFIISTMGLSPRKQILSLWVMLYLWICANRICGPILVYFLCNYAL